MNNLIINVSKFNRSVKSSHSFIGNDGENLQGNLVFIFTDEFIDGIARLETKINNEKNFISLLKVDNTYQLPIKNVLTKEGNIELQLVISEQEIEEGIPLFKSEIFKLYCEKSINATSEAPDGYETWIEEANRKLIEIDNAIKEAELLNIESRRISDGIEITFYKKDGTSYTVKVNDGQDGKAGSIDVQINGVSILSNKIANIPYASSSNVGVVKIGGGYGTYVNQSNGLLTTVSATNNDINLRTNNYKPIVPSNLDYAVRSVKPDTSTENPELLSVNKIYDLGEQSNLSLQLPSGQLGDFIEVDFLSTATPTTLTITSSYGMSDYDLIPEANKIYTLYFSWTRLDTTTYGWAISFAEYTRTAV